MAQLSATLSSIFPAIPHAPAVFGQRTERVAMHFGIDFDERENRNGKKIQNRRPENIQN